MNTGPCFESMTGSSHINVVEAWPRRECRTALKICVLRRCPESILRRSGFSQHWRTRLAPSFRFRLPVRPLGPFKSAHLLDMAVDPICLNYRAFQENKNQRLTVEARKFEHGSSPTPKQTQKEITDRKRGRINHPTSTFQLFGVYSTPNKRFA